MTERALLVKGIRRWLAILLTLCWMGVIFFMSSVTGTESGGMSRRVAAAVGRVFHGDYDEWLPEEQTAFEEGLQFPIRKAAHFAEYALLGLWLSATLHLWGMGGRRRFFAAWAAGTVYAASDEIHQLFVSGRGAVVTDVLIDCAGVLAGCGLAALILFWRIKRRKKSG